MTKSQEEKREISITITVDYHKIIIIGVLSKNNSYI